MAQDGWLLDFFFLLLVVLLSIYNKINMKNYALITGASGGIGLDLAELFAEDKINLILVARSENKLNEIAKNFERKYNIKVYTIAKDLSKEKSALELFNEVTSKNLKVEFLVNNAGFGSYKDFVSEDWEVYNRMLNLNIISLVYLSHLFANEMIKNGYGKILNVASTAGFQPIPGLNIYSATKAFVLSFSEALHHELKDKRITVTTLCPGSTITNFHKTAGLKGRRFIAMKSKTVAKCAYNAMMKGKQTTIPGIMNKISVFTIRFAPRKLVPVISKKIIKGI